MTELNHLRRENADLRHKLGVRDRQLAKLRQLVDDLKADLRETDEELKFECKQVGKLVAELRAIKDIRLTEASGATN